MVAGLDDYNYLLGLAVDSGDPKTVVVSASQGAYQAHSREDAQSLVYSRTSSTDAADNNRHDKEWKVVKGLPEPTWNNHFDSCGKSKSCRRILCCQQPWNILLY